MFQRNRRCLRMDRQNQNLEDHSRVLPRQQTGAETATQEGETQELHERGQSTQN
jgi:hypothetical protein